MPYLVSNSRYLVIALLSLLFWGCETASMKKVAASKTIESQHGFQVAIAEEARKKTAITWPILIRSLHSD